MKSMVWAVFQYGVERWTLKKSDRIEASEMWWKMLCILWQEHHINDSILTELGLERELMGRVAKLKLQYFGHITRGSAGQLALTVLEGIVLGLRHQGRPRRQWIHDIEEWTGCDYIQLKEMSQDRAQWRRKISEWSSAVANPHRGRSTSEWLSYVELVMVLMMWYTGIFSCWESFQLTPWLRRDLAKCLMPRETKPKLILTSTM